MLQRPIKPVTIPATREPRYRVPFPAKAVISGTGSGSVKGWLLMVSSGGGYVQNKTRFQKGVKVQVEAQLSKNADQKPVRITGWVAYDDGQGVGIQFDEPNPEVLAAIQRIAETSDQRGK